MDKLKAQAKIEQICKEAGLYYLLFENEGSMQEFFDDMRRGANLKAGLKMAGLPLMKEYLL